MVLAEMLLGSGDGPMALDGEPVVGAMNWGGGDGKYDGSEEGVASRTATFRNRQNFHGV